MQLLECNVLSKLQKCDRVCAFKKKKKDQLNMVGYEQQQVICHSNRNKSHLSWCPPGVSTSLRDMTHA